jgi:serine/threonine protein kinase
MWHAIASQAVIGMEASEGDTARLFRALIRGSSPDDSRHTQGPDAKTKTPESVSPDVARRLFADFGLDTASFYGRYELTLNTALTEMDAASHAADDPLAGMRDTAFVLGRAVEASARLSGGGRAPTREQLATLTARLQRPDVMTTVRTLYWLDGKSRDAEPGFSSARRGLLESIDWEKVRVHRLGTTSLILVVPATLPSTRQYVIKLVHFLFQGVQPIRDATRGYFAETETAREGCPHVAEVFGSGDGWIIQEYVGGWTLAEYVAEYVADPSFDPALGHLELLRSVFVPIVSALALLHDTPVASAHADLNPSNIILQRGDGIPSELLDDDLGPPGAVIRFIDLGRNLLASDVIGRVKSPDAHFVAPEVVALEPDAPAPKQSADYYSLGLLLPVCLGLSRPADLRGGQIPEALFARAPLLARVMADLADPRPDKRLVALARDFPLKSNDLNTLAHYLLELDASLTAAHADSASDSIKPLLRGVVRATLDPASGLRRLAQALDSRGLPHARDYRYLSRWANVATAAFWACVLIVAVSLWARYGTASDVNALTFSSDQLRALLGSLGIAMDHASNSRYNQACAVGLSFAVACYVYYVKVFKLADLRRCVPHNRFAYVCEIMMRLMTLLVLPFVFVGNFLLPEKWIWFSAAGMTMVALNNVVVLKRQRQIISALEAATEAFRDAYPAAGYWEGLTPSKRLGEWVPTLFCFTAVVAVLAVALAEGYGRDYGVYAVLMTTLNVLFFGYLHAARQGPEIAPSLLRTAVLADRWRID